jgi:Peptidase C13 family
VSVVSFGLFGDQGVFRGEATGAAQVVAGRFRSGPINVQYNSKRGGGATIEALAMSLQAAANGMDAENDVLFLILTSHGSRAGLAVRAGRLTQTLTPSNLAEMLARTGMRYKVVVISACYSGVFILVSRTPIRWSSRRPMPTIRRSAAGTRPGGPISAMPFSTSRSGKLKA